MPSRAVHRHSFCDERIELDTLSYILQYIVGKVCHKANACGAVAILSTNYFMPSRAVAIIDLTVYPIIQIFKDIRRYPFKNFMGKGENACNQH